ncbi:MAG: SpoIIE family protein phosphatase [Spirochaetia bacterium]|nr:SpoIIE family protein phosphatase [Spirochaetia bacterium]
MKPVIISKIRSSLSTRISLWTVLFAAVVFNISLIVVGILSREAVREEAVRAAGQVLDNTILRTNYILEDVENLADNMEWLIYKDIDNPDAMMEYSRSIVLNNSFLNGCSISFEPYFYPQKGKYFSCYSNNNGRYVYTTQEGSDNYQYFYLNWYMLPKLLNQPCWTEPYTDQEEGDEATMNMEMNVSYCKPLTGNDGSFIGVLSLDISLKWLSETISAVKPYPNAFAFLLGRGGTFLVHPDPEKLFYESIFTESLNGDMDPELVQLGKDMLAWKEGMSTFKIDGKSKSCVIYKPLLTTGWSLAIVCPESDIFGSYNKLRNILGACLILGLILMFLVTYNIIHRQLLPLQKLATHAETIASGKFDVELPHMDRTDEIGVLNRAFRFMQVSLISYIDKLTSATAKRERIEGELRIARDIQMGMVPSTFPAFPGRADIDLYASISPAKEVGGDLYDFFIQDEKLYFCIGDVSGKGIPASLLMAVARNLFRSVASEGLPPEEVARRINDTISEDNKQMMFITMFIGMADLATGTLRFCNCGHNPPVLLKTSAEFMQCESNIPIGVAKGMVFKGQSLDNFRGTPILLYTDGLNEAENNLHEEFGNKRLLSAISGTPYQDAKSTIGQLLKLVSDHVGDAEQSDDLTMLCLKLL